MKNLTDVAFILQARSGSTRVPNKMLKPFAGSCLFEIALKKILNSSIIPKESFYVSILDEEFVEIANKYDVNIYRRDPASIEEPVELPVVFGWHNSLPRPYKYWVSVNACNPILPIQTIDRFIHEFLSRDCRGMFGVIEKKTFLFDSNHSLMNGYEGEDKYLATLETKFCEPTYEAAHSLYAGRMEDIPNHIYTGTFKTPGDPLFFTMDPIEAFDIDWPWQFEIAEAMYKQNPKLSTVVDRWSGG